MDELCKGKAHRPFRNTPDSPAYYPATCHEQALEALRKAILNDESVALLTGETGTGKTLLCHCLLERLGPETVSAFLTNTHFASRTALLQAICFDFGVPFEGRGEQELRLALTEFLLASAEEGKRNVLVIDEAHHLTADLLEELRLLTNLEAPQVKVFQVVLVGQGQLLEAIEAPALASLAQRLVTRGAIEPLTVHEAADYIVHQVRQAGLRSKDLFTDEAIGIIARGSRGVPRLLNQSAQQALGLARAAQVDIVDAEVALEAIGQLGLEAPEPAEEMGPVSLLDDLDGADLEPGASKADGAEESEGPPRGPSKPPSNGKSPSHLFGPHKRPA
jgi:type II secretory pathway predicted ATPase ExeA